MNIISSHTLMIALTTVLVIFMIFAVKSNADQWYGFIKEAQAEQVCAQLQKSIFKIYNPGNHNTDSLMSKMSIALADKIAGSEYDIIFNGSIQIRSGVVQYLCEVNLPVVLTGSAKGGSIQLSYFRKDVLDNIQIS